MKKLSLPFPLVLEGRLVGILLLIGILTIAASFAPDTRAGPITLSGRSVYLRPTMLYLFQHHQAKSPSRTILGATLPSSSVFRSN
jgi:hypothetical protein